MSHKSHPGDGSRNLGVKGGGLWGRGFKDQVDLATRKSFIGSLLKLFRMLHWQVPLSLDTFLD